LAFLQYLKEQRAPVMTFIPLQTIKAKPVSEHLRALGGSAKLIIDVIQYDPSLEKAFLFACGQTLVCDDVDETKRLAYSADRHKGERTFLMRNSTSMCLVLSICPYFYPDHGETKRSIAGSD
jgi:hypothetical protein